LKNWNNIGPVTVKNYGNGRVYAFKSLEEFFSMIGFSLLDRIGGEEVKKKFDTSLTNIFKYNRCVVVFDQHGLIIPVWKIEEVYRVAKKSHDDHWGSWRIRDCKHCVHRRDPIPGTSKRRGTYFGSWYKKPKTMAERRAAEALASDEEARYYNVRVRGRRSNHNLPEPYDDRPRGDADNRRNWKQNRKTQWKPLS